MDESRHLISQLQSLRPQGPEGFEGLVARLLEGLTGQRFYLAHAGSQDGRDMSTGGVAGTGIFVEAKRFHSPKSFDRRELLGELCEASQDPRLDLWVLASTVRVPDQIISILRKEGASRGIDIETLDARPESLGDLAVLCAAHEDAVLSFFGGGEAAGNLRQLLETIRRQPQFEMTLGSIRDRFCSSSIGYAQARTASLSYLRSAFEDAQRARVELGQPINVLQDGGLHVVERRQALDALESWWSDWPRTLKPLVFLGEEGMGKTWALASWLARYLDIPDHRLPLTLFLPSYAVSASKALDLIADALVTCTGVRDARFWSRRAEAFVARSPAKRPALLLVLDGVNEQPRFEWRTLLQSLQSSPWSDQVATVLTCRPGYWREYLDPTFRGSCQFFKVGSYDDDELASALEKGGLRANDLLRTLEPLLRRPRYFDLTVRHRVALEQSGDVTVDRLLYEDWKDRASRKKGLFSDDDFRTLLVQLAEKHREGLLSKREVEDLLPSGSNFLTGLDEIITGGILIRDPLGRFAVEPRRLIQGLGLLLAEQVRSVWDQGEAAMHEAMASLLEPQEDMDRKVAICRSAATFAILEPDFPETARAVLFEQWIGSRNQSQEDTESFISYLPASPDVYLRLVKRFWKLRRENHQVRSLLLRAFFHWRDNVQVQQSLIAACETWLSYVHPQAYRWMRGQDDAEKAKLRQEIERRAGQSLQPGENFPLIDKMEVIEDEDSLWLAEPALALVSFFPITPFIPALRRWALSRSIMGHPEEASAVAWILRRSKEDLWPALEAAIGPLLDGPRVAQQAAWRLLWACGREEAPPVIGQLPKDLFPPTYYEESYAEDPCQSWWRREDCAVCAARPDLPDRLVALKLAPHVLDPDFQIDFDVRPRLRGALAGIQIDQLSPGFQTTKDDHDFREIEPTLAAFAPDLLAATYRSLVHDLPNRSEEAQQALLWQLDAIVLILGSQERSLIRKAWDQICQAETWSEKTENAEVDLFTALLFDASAKSQLDLILCRPPKAFDDIKLGHWIKRLSAKDVRTIARNLIESTPIDLQRKLWFLWYQPKEPVVEVVGAEKLVDLLDHPVPEVQKIAQDLLLFSGSSDLFDVAVHRGKVTPGSTQSWRRYWGGHSAAHLRSRLPYRTLAKAVDLGTLSYLVQRKPRDLFSYVSDLDQAIRAAASTKDETLNIGYCTQALKEIAKRYRKIVGSWVQLVVEASATQLSLVKSCHMMLESLCEVLLETDPEQGAELFKALLAYRQHARTVDNPVGVDVLTLKLFKAPQSRQVEELLHQWFEGCKTDKDLFELALAGSFFSKGERLSELIRTTLSSFVSSPVEKATALGLVGFSVYGSQSAALLEWTQFHPEGWLHEIQNWARRNLERDRWAQEWFRRFVVSSRTQEAFAAFRLFLRCVDRRYWVWRNDVLSSGRLKAERRQYLVGSRDQIDKAIEGNEKKIEKRFLGRDIPENKAYPWLKRYLG